MDRAEIVHENFRRRVAAGDFPVGNDDQHGDSRRGRPYLVR